MRFAILSFLPPTLVGLAAAEVLLDIDVAATGDCRRQSKLGDTLYVNYNLTFTNGTFIESNFDKTLGEWDPFDFVIGTGNVIKGWHRGMLDMCVGERRKLTLGPRYAYGSGGSGPIPPNSTLVFSTELVRLSEGSSPGTPS